MLGRPASQETLGKLAKTLDDAHAVRARLGDGGESDVIGPDEIDKLRDPAKRLAAWRRLITDTVESVTVAPAMTADGRPSRRWNPRRIDISVDQPVAQRADAGRGAVQPLAALEDRCDRAASGLVAFARLGCQLDGLPVPRDGVDGPGRQRRAIEHDLRHG